MGRKYGQSMQLMLSGLNVNMSTKTSILLQLESQINDLKRQLDLPQNNHQSEKKTIKSKLDDLNNKLAKEMISRKIQT